MDFSEIKNLKNQLILSKDNLEKEGQKRKNRLVKMATKQVVKILNDKLHNRLGMA
jgi:hypothetical protein